MSDASRGVYTCGIRLYKEEYSAHFGLCAGLLPCYPVVVPWLQKPGLREGDNQVTKGVVQDPQLQAGTTFCQRNCTWYTKPYMCDLVERFVNKVRVRHKAGFTRGFGCVLHALGVPDSNVFRVSSPCRPAP